MTIRIVTDSTADITQEIAAQYNLTVVPLSVSFGEKTYLDNVNLDIETFYRKLQESKELPHTSQPAPAAFQEAYIRLIDEGAESILSVHLSARLSGTYQSACTARDTLPEQYRHIPIEIVDSTTVSAGIFMALQQATKEIQQGFDLATIKAHFIDQCSRTRVLAILDTLEYLHKGGRIGGAKALLGNMLSVKPILALKDGEVAPVEQPRTRTKAYIRASQIAMEAGQTEQIVIVESNEEVGAQLYDVLKKYYPHDIPRYKLGSTLGSHTGPGTVGIVFVIKNPA
ncbi:MAG TPA: DegV family protein [Dictyobacter sp.]|jgi:DegV family protein with EDD domain|nr:DegV family protein [Dictyobacter sp.]